MAHVYHHMYALGNLKNAILKQDMLLSILDVFKRKETLSLSP